MGRSELGTVLGCSRGHTDGWSQAGAGGLPQVGVADARSVRASGDGFTKGVQVPEDRQSGPD